MNEISKEELENLKGLDIPPLKKTGDTILSESLDLSKLHFPDFDGDLPEEFPKMTVDDYLKEHHMFLQEYLKNHNMTMDDYLTSHHMTLLGYIKDHHMTEDEYFMTMDKTEEHHRGR